MNVKQGFGPRRPPVFAKKIRGNLSRRVISHPYFRKNKSNTVTPTSLNSGKFSIHSTINSARSSKSRSVSSAISTTSDSVISSENSHMIVAICEGRGQSRGEVGIAALDLRRPELGLYQVSDTQGFKKTITVIQVLNPIEILVPITLAETRIVQILKKQFKNINLNTVVRRWFDGNSGVQLINHLCPQMFANNLLNMQHKYYALSAASALVKYLENIKHVTFAARSLKVIYLRTHEMTAIDWDTTYRLELVTPTKGTNKNSSLLGILNHCITNGGTRLLRANILQPPCVESVIMERLNAVEELIYSTEVLSSIKIILSKFKDVDYILTLCMKTPDNGSHRAAEMQLNYILILKSILNAVPALLTSIEDAKSVLFLKLKNILQNLKYQKINEIILKIINQDSFPSKGHLGDMQRCFAVRSGVNELLDFSRTIYSGLLDDARDIVKKLADVYKLPFSLNHNIVKGFHIVMKLNPRQTINAAKDLPKEFINVTKHPQYLTMTTVKLIELNHRIKNTQRDIEIISNHIVCNLLNEIREDTGSLYMLCECVAELDLIQSLADAGSHPSYVKPTFSTYLDVVNSRHPMLDFLSDSEPIPNDIFSTKDNNFNIITGPNMSGKSIYIKQIALLHIMAQIGSFVPAEKACLRITDYIFTRINFDDSIEHDASTFQLDIRETKIILEALTPTSLVIIDEFCRGTCHTDGCAMAWTLCEQFIKRDAFVFIATHFITLTKLDHFYFNVTNWHMEAKEILIDKEVRLTYTYRLKLGITTIQNYGLAAARASAMPSYVVNNATDFMQKFTPSVTIDGLIPKIDPIEGLKYRTISKIRFLFWKNELTMKNLKEMVLRFRKVSSTLELKTNIFGSNNININIENILKDQSEDAISHGSLINISTNDVPIFCSDLSDSQRDYMPIVPEICYSQGSTSTSNGTNNKQNTTLPASTDNNIQKDLTFPSFELNNLLSNEKPKFDFYKGNNNDFNNLNNNKPCIQESIDKSNNQLQFNVHKDNKVAETAISKNDITKNHTPTTPLQEMEYFNLETSSSNLSSEQSMINERRGNNIVEYSDSTSEYNENNSLLFTSDTTPNSSQTEISNTNNVNHKDNEEVNLNFLSNKKIENGVKKPRSFSFCKNTPNKSFGPIFTFARGSNEIKKHIVDFEKPSTSYSVPTTYKSTSRSVTIKSDMTTLESESFHKCLQTSSSSNLTINSNETSDFDPNTNLNYKKISIEILEANNSTKSSTSSSITRLFSDQNTKEYNSYIKNIPTAIETPESASSFKIVFKNNKICKQ